MKPVQEGNGSNVRSGGPILDISVLEVPGSRQEQRSLPDRLRNFADINFIFISPRDDSGPVVLDCLTMLARPAPPESRLVSTGWLRSETARVFGRLGEQPFPEGCDFWYAGRRLRTDDPVRFRLSQHQMKTYRFG